MSLGQLGLAPLVGGAVSAGLRAVVAVAVLTAVAAVVAPMLRRSVVAGVGSVLLGLVGAATGAAAAGGARGDLVLTTVLPGGPSSAGSGWAGGSGGSAAGWVAAPVVLAPDRLGGVFMLVAGLVGAVAAGYGIGYVQRAAASRTAWVAYVVFVAGMLIVPAAGDVVGFLLGWELMAVGSTVLLLADHELRASVRTAAVWYAVMTHLSFVLLAAGFAVLVARAGTTSLSGIAGAGISGRAASVAFVLLVLGFATKAGLVPLHVWLPRAHPEAPSHVSAAMSGAMVKMGAYGSLLVTQRLLPAGPRWWSVGLLALGAGSALYGILQASVTSDLKRLLAYSTTENMGLIVTAIATGSLLRGVGMDAVADVAVTAALLLVVSHAAFKTALFLAAGAVLHATGERDLDRLGGLGRVMPVAGASFAVACLGAAALPVSSGFVAEWTLLQSLIHGPGRQDRLAGVLLPMAVAVVALTAGLALLTFVKAYAIAFLARPRSDGARTAHASGPTMRAAMVVSAAAVLALGLAAGPVARFLASTAGARGVEVSGTWGLRLPAVDALLDPVALLALAFAVALPVAAVTLVQTRRRPRRRVDLAWGCGGVRVGPRMQYTATSYAEPLVRVFDDALRPSRDLHVTHAEESRYLEEQVVFRQQVGDALEVRLYAPVTTAVEGLGRAARRLQNGSVHRYLAFSFVALTVLLVVVSR